MIEICFRLEFTWIVAILNYYHSHTKKKWIEQNQQILTNQLIYDVNCTAERFQLNIQWLWLFVFGQNPENNCYTHTQTFTNIHKYSNASTHTRSLNSNVEKKECWHTRVWPAQHIFVYIIFPFCFASLSSFSRIAVSLEHVYAKPNMKSWCHSFDLARFMFEFDIYASISWIEIVYHLVFFFLFCLVCISPCLHLTLCDWLNSYLVLISMNGVLFSVKWRWTILHHIKTSGFQIVTNTRKYIYVYEILELNRTRWIWM